MLSFADFIRSDKHTSLQRSKLINLHEKSKTLQVLGIQKSSQLIASSKPFLFTLFSQKDQDINYKLEKLKLKIQDGDTSNKVELKKMSRSIKESKRIGWIFIMCLLQGDTRSAEIKMLQEKDFDVNVSMLKIPFLPSYYFLAHIYKVDKLLTGGKKTTAWNGIPLCFVSQKDYTKFELISITSVTQFKLMMELKLIFDCNHKKDEVLSWKEKQLQDMLVKYNAKNNETPLCNEYEKYEKAVYLADLLAIKDDYKAILLLEKPYHISNFSFLVQTNLETVFALLKNGHKLNQSIKKITPLHIAAMKGNLPLLAIYLEAGLEINSGDLNGNTALHYAAIHGNANCFDYMTKRNFKGIQRKYFIAGDEEALNNDLKKPVEMFIHKNGSEKSSNPECVIAAYRRTVKEQIVKAPRFKVITNRYLSYEKLPEQIEAKIKRLESIRIEKDFLYATNEGFYYLNKIIEKSCGEAKKLPKEPEPDYVKIMEEYETDNLHEFFD